MNTIRTVTKLGIFMVIPTVLNSTMNIARHTNPRVESTNMTVNPNSIRQICLNGFLAGTPRAEIAARIKELHPNTMAAQKSAVHIAWHYGDMKKSGLLKDAPISLPMSGAKREAAPVKVTEVTEAPEVPVDATPAEPTEAELIAARAAEMAARIDAQLADAE